MKLWAHENENGCLKCPSFNESQTPHISSSMCTAQYESFHCLKRSTPCTSQLWTQLTLSLWLTLSVPGSEGKVGHLGLILTVVESSPRALIIESQLANYHIKYRTVAKKHTAQCDSQLHGVTWWVNSSVTTRKNKSTYALMAMKLKGENVHDALKAGLTAQ